MSLGARLMRAEIIRKVLSRTGQPPGCRVAALLLAAALLAGCGETRTVGPTRIVQVALTEYRLSPRSLTARPGSLTLVVHNYGRLTHNLAVLGARDLVIGETPPIVPGSSAVLAVTVGYGHYALASTLFDDRSLGVVGTLAVSR